MVILASLQEVEEENRNTTKLRERLHITTAALPPGQGPGQSVPQCFLDLISSYQARLYFQATFAADLDPRRMSEAPEAIVEYAYDNITTWYLEWVSSQKSPRERYTQDLLNRLQPSPSILELGCGPGVPVLKVLLNQGAKVVANDISKKQIEMAEARFPDAELIHGNMTSLTFEPERFHGIVSFYTLFHLPRAKLREMLLRIYGWLKPGGLFVFNLTTLDEEEIHGEFLGYGMFWSSYDVAGNELLLTEAGFDLLRVEVMQAGDGKLQEDEPDFDAEFMWVVAQKKSPP